MEPLERAEARLNVLNKFVARHLFEEPTPPGPGEVATYEMMSLKGSWLRANEPGRPWVLRDWARMSAVSLYNALSYYGVLSRFKRSDYVASVFSADDCQLGSYVATWGLCARLKVSDVMSSLYCWYGDYPGEAMLRSLIQIVGLEEKLFRTTTAWLLKQKS